MATRFCLFIPNHSESVAGKTHMLAFGTASRACARAYALSMRNRHRLVTHEPWRELDS